MKSFKKIIIVAVAFVLSLLSLCACNVEKKNVFISSISVGDDFKTDFVLGEELNLDGIKLNLFYEDGSIGFVYLDEKMITGFNTLTEGSKTMTITYEGITLDIKYSVVDPAVYNSLIYTVQDNCVTVTGLNNFYTSQTLTIPNTIQGFPVTEIGEGAFKNKYLYSVTLPDSVTRIGNSAFMNCSVLISVNTPASLVSIGEQAFYNCVKLSSFNFGDSIKNIGAYAFQYSALTQLTLPSDTTVGEGAFSNCNKLTYLEADFTNSQTPANIFKNSMKLTAINTLVINGKIDSINQDIFYYGENNQYKLGQNVRAVTLPETVTQIDQYTFEGFTNLRTFTVPDSVAIIGDGAFKDCISLTSFNVGNATDIGDKILYNCVSLKNISLYLNNTVTFENYFGDSASDLFSINLNVNTDLNCISPLFFSYTDTDKNNVKFTSVKSIAFSERVNSIENETFKDFTLVDSINLSDIEIIGDYAFQNCINLKHLTGSENNNSLDKLSYLGEGAFWGAVSITEIFLPETLVNVKQNVFKNCTGIKNLALSFKVVNDAGSSPAQSSAVALLSHQISYDVNLSETGLYYFFGDTVPSLLSLTVYNLQVLEKSSLSVGNENNYIKINTIAEIILPSSLTEIKEGTFENLPITQINIPSQITTLENNLFSNCSLLETVNLNNIVTIKNGVFSNCVSLSDIVFGNQLSSIGKEAFLNCSSIESLSVPASVSVIGSSAFKNCTALVEVDLLYDIYSDNNLTEISESLFEGCEKLKRVYDGQGTVPGSDSYVILPYTVTKIGKYAFKDCASINNVNLSKSSAVGVAQIGESAFENCISLRNLNVDNVQNFGSSSFLNCNLLGSVQFKASNVIINESAFQNCYSLSGLEIGANINSVKSKAFYNCYSLSRIEIKSSSVLFGNSVFECETRDASVTELILPLNIRKYSESSGTFAESYSDINLSYYFGATLLPLLSYLEVLSGLTTVTYSETSDADYTFKGATNVETLILPNTITTIYNKALSKLTTINSLTIPFVVKDESQNSAASFKGLTHLFGTTDFSNITDLTILDNGLTSSGVTISENAFQNCVGLEEVDLSYVTSIGNSAFKGCVNLYHIGGLAAVTSIGNNAFENCPLSDNIVFSSNITDIGDNAFKGCLGLTSVAFASNTDFSALTVGASPFNGCFNITTFKAPFAFGTGNNMPTLLSWFGEFGVSELNLTSLEIYSADTITSNFLNDKNGVKYSSLITLYIDAVIINENAFSGCNAITTLAFGERLTAIGNQAFKNCTRITSLVLPSSLQILETSVFQGCSSVTTLAAPLNLREAGNDTKISRRLNYYFGGINSVSLTSFTLVNNGTESQKISLSENAFSSFVNLTTIALKGFVSEIGKNAFSDCSKLTSITGLENVISIGDQAFENCVEITEITIPNSVTSIGSNAFKGCSKLNTVNLSTSLQTISSGAFENCVEITEITIPNTVTSIGDNVFKGCSKLNTVTLSTSLQTIASGAFENCVEITTITIPNTVTSIGDNVFKGCSKLNTVALSTSLQTIASGAFENCVEITTITIPNTVTSIGDNVFKGCSKLNTVTLSTSLQSIASAAFENCVEITTITIPNTVISIGSNAFKGCSKLNTVTLSTSLQTISSGAFENCVEITTITMSNAVTSIGSNAFKGCSKLNTVALSTSLQTIASGAFENCVEITTITMSNAVTSIGSNAFKGCSKLNTVTLSTSLQTISSGAFENCVEITAITIPNTITSIGDNAFKGCLGLTSVAFASNTDFSALTVGASPFNGCFNITTFKAPFAFETGNNMPTLLSWFGEFGVSELNLTSLEIYSADTITSNFLNDKNGVKYSSLITLYIDAVNINQNVFSGCNKLNTITMSNSVTSIGDNAFKGCSKLNTVTLSTSLQSIASAAFENCVEITTITIPNTITSIGDNAFKGCLGLTSVAFASNTDFSALTVGASPFNGCFNITTFKAPFAFGTGNNMPTLLSWFGEFGVSELNLTSLEIYSADTITSNFLNDKNGVKYSSLITLYIDAVNINQNVFSGCNKLNTITMSNSVTSIGDNAFKNCSKLNTVTLSTSLQTIASGAFENCVEITTITMSNAVTSIGSNAFKGCSKLSTVTLSTSLQTISSGAFENCVKITEITIPNSVTSIGSNAFKGCSKLNTVTLSTSLQSIASAAFENCVEITTITMSNAVTSIGSNAFKGCSKLNTVTLSTSLQSIASAAFENCVEITTITIPNTITSIGDNAFKGCLGLTSVAFASNTDFSALTVGASPFNGCFNITTFKAPFAFGTGNNMPTLLSWFGEFGVSELNLTSLEIYSADTITSNFLNDKNGVKYSSLITLYIDAVIINENTFSGCNTITTLAFGKRLTAIGNQAFKNCTRVTSLVLPSSLQILGTSVFQGCSSVTTLSAPLNLREAGNDTKISRRLNYYFGGINSVSLTSFTLVNNGTESQKISLSENAFSSFVNLTTIALKGFVSEIGKNAFSDCSKLTSITGLENVISIGDQAFSNTAVETLVFSELLSVAGNRIFYNCDDLISLTIPFEIKSEASADSILRNINYFFGENSDTNQINLQFLSIISENGLILENDVFCGLDSLTGIELGDKVKFSSGVDYQTLINLKNLKINSIITLPEEVMDFPTGLIPQNIEKIEFIDNATASLYLQNDNWKVFSGKFIYPEISEN